MKLYLGQPENMLTSRPNLGVEFRVWKERVSAQPRAHWYWSILFVKKVDAVEQGKLVEQDRP